jgi:hypothetical protein
MTRALIGADRGASKVEAKTPLPVLLAHVLLDINRMFERTGAEVGERPNLVIWANLLRVIPDEGIAASDIAPAARISRRVVQSWLRRSKQHWLDIAEVAPHVKTVKLTHVGRRKRDAWGELVARTEREWTTKVAGQRTLRAALETLVAKLDLELPHYPITYGPVDWSVTGGPAIRAKAGPPAVPSHGTDWAPVFRDGLGDVERLPMHALLSQALVAFTIDFEEQGWRTMAGSALLVRAMPTRSVAFDSLPEVLSVAGDGKSALERHGILRVSGHDDARIATLTKTGEWICDNHDSIIDRVTQEWRNRYGADVLDALIASLAEVDARLGRALPDYVVVRHDVRGGFADVSFATDF